MEMVQIGKENQEKQEQNEKAIKTFIPYMRSR